MSKNHLLIVFAILSLLGISAFYVYRGLSNVVENTSGRLSYNSEIGQYPVNFEESNTLATVCPEGASGVQCDYFGPLGIQQALNTGGRDHTIFLRSGTYDFTNVSGLLYGLNTEENGRNITLVGDGKNTVLLLKSSGSRGLISFTGDNGISLRNFVIKSENEGVPSNIAVISGADTSITLDNVLVEGFARGLSIFNSNTVRVVRSTFYKNDLGIYENPSSSRPGRFNFTNSIFISNKNPLALERDMSSVYIHNNVFYKNGASIFNSGGVSLVNNIFYEQNGAVILTNANQKMINDNSNLFYNVSTPCFFYNLNTLTYTNCTFTNNTLDTNPLFTSMQDSYDFTLQEGSPAIDFGYEYINDLDGSPSDLGAYGGPEACLQSRGCSMIYPSIVLSGTTDLNSDGVVNLIDVVLGLNSNQSFEQLLDIIKNSFN